MVFITNAVAIVALLSSSAPLVVAQGPSPWSQIPITVGRMSIPRGYLMLAWTPTKTTMNDLCNGTSTRTILQAVHTNRPSNPLCGHPFEVDGIQDMKLICDETQPAQEIPLGISTDGKRTHKCTYLPQTISATYCGPSSGGASLAQSYACQ